MKKRIACLFIAAVTTLATPTSPASGREEGSHLTLYVYPPHEPLDWSTPRNLIATMAGLLVQAAVTKDDLVRVINDFKESGTISSDYRSTMGHTIAHVTCRLSSGAAYAKWASFSGQDFPLVDKKLIFDDQIGLGVLFYNYLDGHIIAGEENPKRLIYYTGHLYLDRNLQFQRVHPHYFEFSISPRQCDQLKEMIDFFEGFHFPPGTTIEDLERKPPESVLYFSSVLDPYGTYLKRKNTGHGLVGGGCAPFAVGLLKLTGLHEALFERRWLRHLPVSESLIGDGRSRRVGLDDILLSELGDSWAKDGVPSRRMKIYDPQLIWNFVERALTCLEPERDPDQACPNDIAKWLHAHGSKIKAGPRRVFSDVSPRLERDADGQMVWIRQKVTQPIDGVIFDSRP